MFLKKEGHEGRSVGGWIDEEVVVGWPVERMKRGGGHLYGVR